jgi:hypothetical protein
MARMIDEKGRILGKVSIVDLIILLVIVALAFAYLYRDRAADISPQAKTVVVKAVCPNVYPGIENNLHYRIKKVEQLMQIDLSQMENRVNTFLAIKLYDLMQFNKALN